MIATFVSSLVLAVAIAGGPKQEPFSGILGTWEGESKCTVPDSPCHDEHVVYEIKPMGDKATIAGYKIVKGEKLYMGDLVCAQPSPDGTFHCSIDRPSKNRTDDWVFQVKGRKMDGTLYMDPERTVFRKIHVEKK